MRRNAVIDSRIAVAAVLLVLGARTASAADQCREDAASGAPPTYTQRFDPKDSDDGMSAFVHARERAMRFCAQKPCTVDGRNEERKASVYGVGTVVRGRLIVGFNCVPAAPAAESASALLSYPLDKPSDIDDAVAKAREQCTPAHAKAELVDLRPKEDKLIAIFNCGL